MDFVCVCVCPYVYVDRKRDVRSSALPARCPLGRTPRSRSRAAAWDAVEGCGVSAGS